MRIDAYTKVQSTYNTQKTNKEKATQKTGQTDKLELSSVGKDLQIAKKVIKDVPDIREDKVASIKQQIEEGTYQVDTSDFADKLLEQYYRGV